MNAEVFEDCFNMLCGDKIGEGMSRTVYECVLLPGYVVKVETRAQTWQNVIEWETWQTVENTSASRWFAQCNWISPNGKVLIQERTREPATHELIDKVPYYFADIKKQNWGMVKTNKNGKEFLVCHDYGVSLVLQEGVITKRMKKANW